MGISHIRPPNFVDQDVVVSIYMCAVSKDEGNTVKNPTP